MIEKLDLQALKNRDYHLTKELEWTRETILTMEDKVITLLAARDHVRMEIRNLEKEL